MIACDRCGGMVPPKMYTMPFYTKRVIFSLRALHLLLKRLNCSLMIDTKQSIFFYKILNLINDFLDMHVLF